MKEREFKLRLDLDPVGNLGRLHAYIRRISPGYKAPPKLLAKAKQRAVLRRVK